MYLGIDPGHTGGAVIWDGQYACLCWEWKRAGDGYVIRSVPGDPHERNSSPRIGRTKVADLSVVAMRLATEARRSRVHTIVLEAMYIPAKVLGAASVLRASEARGILSQVHMWTGTTLIEPTSTQWRKKVWGKSPPSRGEAKKQARTYAQTVDGMTLPKSDHACEALCMAEYGRLIQTEEQG